MNKYTKLIGLILVTGYFLYCASNPGAWHFIDGVNLIFHEAGHWIFSLFGEFMQVLGGSLNQVLIPLIVAGYFFITQQFASGFITLMWAGQSLINVSVYAADALKMQLPLLGGDGVIHDWNWLLFSTGQLRHTAVISQTIYWIGVILIVTGILGACYFIINHRDAQQN